MHEFQRKLPFQVQLAGLWNHSVVVSLYAPASAEEAFVGIRHHLPTTEVQVLQDETGRDNEASWSIMVSYDHRPK